MWSSHVCEELRCMMHPEPIFVFLCGAKWKWWRVIYLQCNLKLIHCLTVLHTLYRWRRQDGTGASRRQHREIGAKTNWCIYKSARTALTFFCVCKCITPRMPRTTHNSSYRYFSSMRFCRRPCSPSLPRPLPISRLFRFWFAKIQISQFGAEQDLPTPCTIFTCAYIK